MKENFQKMSSLFAEYGMATAPKENPEELKADMGHVHEDAVTQRSLQSLMAWSVLAALVSFTIWKIFN